MTKKKKLNIGDTFIVKDNPNSFYNPYAGELFKVTSKMSSTNMYRGIYASWGEPAKQNVAMGPYFPENLKPISKKKWETARELAVQRYNDSYAIFRQEEEKPTDALVKHSKTSKKKTAKKKIAKKSKTVPKTSKLELLRKRVADLNATATTLSEFMNPV